MHIVTSDNQSEIICDIYRAMVPTGSGAVMRRDLFVDFGAI